MKTQDKELGPDNKEAGNLVEALHNTINSEHLKINKDIDGYEDEDNSTSGVGKDIFGKYSYTEKIYKGKVYLVQVRDKDQIDNSYKYTKIGIQMPNVEKWDLN